MPELTKESFEDQKGRLEAMAYDHGTTWDLSENDQAAIKAVLAALNEARTSLALVTTERDHALKELAKQDAGNMQGGWIDPAVLIPEPWFSVRVRATNLKPESYQASHPDGEYEGFYDAHKREWCCYTGAHDSQHLYDCTVSGWQPLNSTAVNVFNPEQLGENHVGNK